MANVVHKREKRKKIHYYLSQASKRQKKKEAKSSTFLRQTQRKFYFNICHALMQPHSGTEDLTRRPEGSKSEPERRRGSQSVNIRRVGDMTQNADEGPDICPSYTGQTLVYLVLSWFKHGMFSLKSSHVRAVSLMF